MTEFVLAVVVPLPHPESPRARFGGAPTGCVCAAEELQSVPVHVGTQLAAAAPPPRRDCQEQLWALEGAGMAGEGHGALQSTRMLLGAGLHCWKVTVDTMEAAEPEMYSQGYMGTALGSHW